MTDCNASDKLDLAAGRLFQPSFVLTEQYETCAPRLGGKAGIQAFKFGTIMTDLNSLLIFAQVVEANSFSEAARRLKMPTSTVSRRIAELEDQLGVRLLERSTRSLRLTDVGTEVLEHAQRGAEVSEAVSNIASNHLSKVSGTLRIAAPPSISDSLLAPLVGSFQASYPDVRVQIFITERIVDQIAEGVDLVFKISKIHRSSLAES